MEIKKNKDFDENQLYQFGVVQNSDPRIKRPKFNEAYPNYVISGTDFIKKYKSKNFYDFIQKNPLNLPVGTYNCYVEGMSDRGKPQLEWIGVANVMNISNNTQQTTLADELGEKSNANIVSPGIIAPTKPDIDANKIFENALQMQREFMNTQKESASSSFAEIISGYKETIAQLKEQNERSYEIINQLRSGESNTPILQMLKEVQNEKKDLLENFTAEKQYWQNKVNEREKELREYYEDKLDALEDSIVVLKTENQDLTKQVAILEADKKLLEETAQQKAILDDQLASSLSGIEDEKRKLESSNTVMGFLTSPQAAAIVPPVIEAVKGMFDTFMSSRKGGQPANITPNVQTPVMPQQYVMPQQIQQVEPVQQVNNATQNYENDNETEEKNKIREMLVENNAEATDTAVNAIYDKIKSNPDTTIAPKPAVRPLNSDFRRRL